MLIHPVLKRMTEEDIHELLDGCNKFGGLISRIEMFAAKRGLIAEENKRNDVQNKWKGDLFELFGEFYLREFGSTKYYNLKDYEPNLEEDYGVDGSAICCRTQSPLAIQFKYKSNRDAPLNINESHLCNVYSQAGPFADNPKFKVMHPECFWFFSSAREIGSEVQNNPGLSKARFILFDEIESMIRNVNRFWERFVEECIDSLNQYLKITLKKYDLRQHQQEYIEAEGSHLQQKGQVWCPTGSGKSMMQMEIIRKLIDGETNV